MILGADPDKQHDEWDEPVAKPIMRRGLLELVNYFGYHRHLRMSQRFNEKDRAILARYCKGKLAKGMSPDALKSLFDKFYMSPYNSSDFPVLMFCKREVQDALLQDVETTSDDPVMEWLLDGMPNECSSLTDPREARRAVILNCEESLMRYPDVVADILRKDDPEPHLSDMLSALDSLIAWNLEESDADSGQYLSALASISLPRELATSVRSPKSIREKRDTVKQAVSAVPRNKESR